MPKRFAAAVLIFVFIINLCPTMALANFQNPVTDLTITDFSTSPANYVVSLRWLRPVYSDKLESDPSFVSAADTRAQGYYLEYKNVSRSQASPTTIKIESVEEILNRQYTLSLDSGSLYEFKVKPYHMHTYMSIVGGQPVLVQRPAPIDTSIKEDTALYLTDLEVTAQGSGQNLTVTWDNPTMNGKEVFTGYRIYYEAGGSQVTQISAPPVEISASSPELKRTRDGKLEYTIQDAALQIGKLYAVKVEPMYNGRLVRDEQTITIQNKEYSISYRNKTNFEYRTNTAYINPALRVRPEGQVYVRLLWDSLITSIQAIERVEIYSAPTADMRNAQRVGQLLGDSARDINFWLTQRPKDITYYQIKIYYNNVSVLSEIAWFDPAHNDFAPYKPSILQAIEDNGAAPYSMKIIWKAFARPAYNDNEKMYLDPLYDSLFIDRNIAYDIYVTDDINNFENPLFVDKIIATREASSLTVTPITVTPPPSVSMPYPSQGATPSYGASVTEYFTRDESGAFVKRTLRDNTVYYVKIVAIRDPGGQRSQPAIGAHFIRPSGPLESNPLMTTNPPLRIKKDSVGADEITRNSIAIEWDTLYLEAYRDSDKGWFTGIGVNDDGDLVFGSDTSDLPADRVLSLNHTKYTNLIQTSFDNALAAVQADLIAAGADENAVNALPIRVMDLSGSEYEIHTATYAAMEAFGGYEAYLAMLMGVDGENLWHAIKPTENTIHPYFTVTTQDIPQDGALMPNTAYIIFFRPFIMSDSKKTAYFPTYVMATTLDDRKPLEIIPTVPVLEPVSQTDAGVTVRFIYSQDLTYELRYSTKPRDYPNAGVSVPWEQIKETAVVENIDGENYLTYTIEGLFPATNHTIWIRATAVGTLSTLVSAWSNPIDMTTDDVFPPEPPRGLGIAAQGHLDLYNEANDTYFSNSDENSIVVEWMRDTRDETENAETSAESDQSATFLNTPELSGMYMVRFFDLLANRKYFFRAKTILTVTQDVDGLVNREYNYTVEASRNADFSNAVGVTVPPLSDIADLAPDKVIRKESAWSQAVSLFTERSDGEYDGNSNPAMYPLPERDYEIIIEAPSNRLTYRFRSDKIDKRGIHDNHVDQRLISRLITNQTYEYTVDFARYFYSSVSLRTVDIPYSVLAAFDERKINLRVKANDTTFIFNPGWLTTAEVKALPDFGKDARVLITLTENDSKTPSLSIQLITPSQKINITETAKPIELETAPNSDTGEVTVASLITDLEVGNLGMFVTANVFNQIIAALVLNRESVSIYETLNEADRNILAKANILIPNVGIVTREAGISALVRVYELKSDRPLPKPVGLLQSLYTDIAIAETQYQERLLQAAEIGFLADASIKASAEPKGLLRMDDFFTILEIILARTAPGV